MNNPIYTIAKNHKEDDTTLIFVDDKGWALEFNSNTDLRDAVKGATINVSFNNGRGAGAYSDDCYIGGAVVLRYAEIKDYDGVYGIPKSIKQMIENIVTNNIYKEIEV